MTDRARPGLVALYDIRPGKGAGQFLQPRSPHGADVDDVDVRRWLVITSDYHVEQTAAVVCRRCHVTWHTVVDHELVKWTHRWFVSAIQANVDVAGDDDWIDEGCQPVENIRHVREEVGGDCCGTRSVARCTTTNQMWREHTDAWRWWVEHRDPVAVAVFHAQ